MDYMKRLEAIIRDVNTVGRPDKVHAFFKGENSGKICQATRDYIKHLESLHVEQKEDARCIRKRVEINGENYYIIACDDYTIKATTPYENRPENMKERQVVDMVCDTVSSILKELYEK